MKNTLLLKHNGPAASFALLRGFKTQIDCTCVPRLLAPKWRGNCSALSNKEEGKIQGLTASSIRAQWRNGCTGIEFL